MEPRGPGAAGRQHQTSGWGRKRSGSEQGGIERRLDLREIPSHRESRGVALPAAPRLKWSGSGGHRCEGVSDTGQMGRVKGHQCCLRSQSQPCLPSQSIRQRRGRGTGAGGCYWSSGSHLEGLGRPGYARSWGCCCLHDSRSARPEFLRRGTNERH